uniref:Uncharacterized protein n=1 Tax=Anguilla anguilla TaxID=7936 RepID=A0A0E9S9L3_ANGAN
MRQAAAVE